MQRSQLCCFSWPSSVPLCGRTTLCTRCPSGRDSCVAIPPGRVESPSPGGVGGTPRNLGSEPPGPPGWAGLHAGTKPPPGAQVNSSTFPSGRDSRSRGVQHPYLPSQTRRRPGVPRAACARDVPWDAEKVRVRPSLRAGCSPGRGESARAGGGSRPGGPPRTAGSSLVTPSSPRRKCPQIATKAQSWLSLASRGLYSPRQGPHPRGQTRARWAWSGPARGPPPSDGAARSVPVSLP